MLVIGYDSQLEAAGNFCLFVVYLFFVFAKFHFFKKYVELNILGLFLLAPFLRTNVTAYPINKGPSSVPRRRKYPGLGKRFWMGRDPGLEEILAGQDRLPWRETQAVKEGQ